MRTQMPRITAAILLVSMLLTACGSDPAEPTETTTPSAATEMTKTTTVSSDPLPTETPGQDNHTDVDKPETEPTEKPSKTNPVHPDKPNHTDPTVKPTDPTKPTQPPVKPTEPPVKPTQPPVKPTEPPVKPTQPPVKPTEPPVKPTEPPVKPTEPPVKPTEPPVKPTEPPVKPTEPPVKPTEPPVYNHNWVFHEEQGHTEVVKEAYDETVTETVMEWHVVCNGCGADFGNGPDAANKAANHCSKDFWDDCEGYHEERVPVEQTKTVHHDAVTEWVVDVPAHWECTVCGEKVYADKNHKPDKHGCKKP